MSNDYKPIYLDYDIDLITYNSDKIKLKTYTFRNTEYKILNYDSQVVCDNDKTNGLYRSIICSPENEILCFSPPKSITLDSFKEKCPNLNDNILINEIIEGTMINLFYDHRNQSWEISSKSAIGGNYWFFRNQYSVDEIEKTKKQLTFREMFLDAFRANTDDINKLPFLEYFPKDYCYNFVLQHPENHIVLNINSPTVYLVSVYHLRQNHIVYISPIVFEEWDCFLNIRGMLDFPRQFTEKNYTELHKKYCSINSRYDFVGCMLTNLATGERTSIENPTYMEVRELRGNNPNLQYQYLCLRHIGKVKDFLGYFPQYKTVFSKFYKQYNDFVTNIHQSYIQYYIQKNSEKISKKYFPHIYKLHHEFYLPLLKTDNKLIIRRAIVLKYVDTLSPIELIYYLNYNKRENLQQNIVQEPEVSVDL